jgi:hypothetical protein
MHLTVIAGLRGAMAYALAYSLPASYKYRFRFGFASFVLFNFWFLERSFLQQLL